MDHKEDVTILGAGVIGLTLALELRRRGFGVQLWEQGLPGMQASWAAAGMLAATDPHNPPALAALAAFSVAAYPAFLERLHVTTGLAVPFQTDSTVQFAADGTAHRIPEHSLDPRQLLHALLAAVQREKISIRAATAETLPDSDFVVRTTGAWSGAFGVRPCKGQMIRVQMPPHERLAEVYRSEHMYVVPRTRGAQAGTALLGATVEDCGFDTVVHEGDLARLRQAATELVPHLPALADPELCPLVEAWAGLRPSTTDGLPLLGEVPADRPGQRNFVATGHFRNGILLAPGTALVIADLLQQRSPAVDLRPFEPSRAAVSTSQHVAPFGHARR